MRGQVVCNKTGFSIEFSTFVAVLRCATYRCNSWYAPPPGGGNLDLTFSEMLFGDHVFARPFSIMQMKLAFYAPHNSCLIPKKCSNYTGFSK